MSRHVAPHRWGDAFAGRVDDAERAAMDRHAEGCAACTRQRERVQRASDTFPKLRAQSAPELPWDSIRARVHWSVSTERRERLARGDVEGRGARRWIARGALVAAAAGVLVVGVMTEPVRPYVVARDGAPVVAPSAAGPDARAAGAAGAAGAAREPVAVALAGAVNRTTGDLMIDGIRATDVFARRLGAGSVLATADGRVDVQFADASAFALGPRSMLELRRFDERAIELVVDGTIDIDVAPRAPGQRFIVHAGDRTIEVRGTHFRVEHAAGTTTVACRHGLVAVRDAHGEIEVGAARRLEIGAGHAVGAERVRPLSVDEVDALAQAAPLTMPGFATDPTGRGWLDALLQGSAPLEIATAGRREVRVDGIELGAAPMRVRVLPGRHTVEVADPAGRFRRAGWVDVGPPGSTPARLVVHPEAPRTRDVGARRKQLHAGIDKPRLARCVRSIAKAGLSGTYVQIEIAVDAQGAIGFLNVIDTDLPSATARCVREVLADVRFGSGSAASWRERIDL